MPMKSRVVALLVSLVSVAGFAGGAGAVSMMTVSFSGFVDSVPSAITAFGVGTSFSGSFMFDLDTPDTNTSARTGFYGDTISEFNLRLGGFSVDSGPGDITVNDNIWLGIRRVDSFVVDGGDDFDDFVGGFRVKDISLYLETSDRTTFASDALPDDLDLAAFDRANVLTLDLWPGIQGSIGDVTGYLDNVEYTIGAIASGSGPTTTMPEPAGALLFATGFAFFRFTTRRRRP
jgi:hypothetical protein